MNYTSVLSYIPNVDIDYGLMRDIETTTASLHDAPVTLELPQIFDLGHLSLAV
jgi:hypothetical protein